MVKRFIMFYLTMIAIFFCFFFFKFNNKNIDAKYEEKKYLNTIAKKMPKRDKRYIIEKNESRLDKSGLGESGLGESGLGESRLGEPGLNEPGLGDNIIFNDNTIDTHKMDIGLDCLTKTYA